MGKELPNSKTSQALFFPNSLPYKIKLLSQSNERRITAALEPFSITPMQYCVLCCLWEEDSIPTAKLAEKIKSLSGNLTVILDGIEARKLVKRVRDDSDKRILRVCLTKDGLVLKTPVLAAVAKIQKESFQNISEDEKETFAIILEKLLTKI